MQVLGKSVADALSYYNEADTVETRRYVLYFDRFFDMLNTCHLKEGYQKKKPYNVLYLDLHICRGSQIRGILLQHA